MSTEHENIRELLHAYVDGELDLANARETQRHLESCVDCRGTERAIRELRGALTSDAPAYRAPAHLRKRVRAVLRQEARSTQHPFSPWLMSPPDLHPWFLALVQRLLEDEKRIVRLLAHNPFSDAPPKFIRADWYRYRFTNPGERGWWTRTFVGEYLPAVTLPRTRDAVGEL